MKTLETERLLLRKVTEKDIMQLHENVYLDPLIYKYQESLFRITKLEQTKKLVLQWLKGYEKKELYKWVICLKEKNTIIGMIETEEFADVKNKYFLMYMIGSKFWNKGYATESAKEVINYMINTVGAYKIIANCYASNLASEKVMKKIGMEYIGTEDQTVIKKKIPVKFYKIVDEKTF